MKKRKGYRLRQAIEKEIGRGKFNMAFVQEALEQNNTQFVILLSNKKIMKHEIIVEAFHKGWDTSKILYLWGRVTEPPPVGPGFAPNPADPDAVTCFIMYDIAFDDLVKKTVQISNLKAFL